MKINDLTVITNDVVEAAQRTLVIGVSGQPAVLTTWHRPLHAMTDAFTGAGFRVAVVSEPPFSPETPGEMLPPRLEGRTSFLSFIFFVLDAN